MKYQGELLLLVVLVLALLVKPLFLRKLLNTFVGRVLALVGILMLASKNKNYGFLASLIMIALLQTFQEGFQHKGDDDSEDDAKDEKEDEEKSDDDNELKNNEEKCEDCDDCEEKSCKDCEKCKKDEENKEEDGKEGFSLLPRIDMRFSEMDPLEAENTVRPKPSSMYPSPDPKTRGQNKNLVNRVLGTVESLFSKA